jgi:hypothetical protein
LNQLLVFAARGWAPMAGLITLLLLNVSLDAHEIGLYYTMTSLASLAWVVDLGFSANALVPLTARAAVSRSRGVARLSGVCMVWYLWGGLLCVLASPLGLLFLESGGGGEAPGLVAGWSLLAIFTAAGVVGLPVLAIAEGEGHLREAYLVRLAQGVSGSLATWALLLAGGGLLAVCAMPLLGVVVMLPWLWLRRRPWMRDTLRARRPGEAHGSDRLEQPMSGDGTVRSLADIWPLQWRGGTSWLAGYVLIFMHAPLLYRVQGPVEAGRMGLTVTLMNAVCVVAMSPLTAVLPALARAAAAREARALDAQFRHAFRRSIALFAMGGAGLVALCLLLAHTAWAARLLDPVDCLLLVAAMGCYHLATLYAAHARAQVMEPFAVVALGAAVLTALLAFWAAPRWGAHGIILGLLAVNGLFYLPTTYRVYRQSRERLHRGSAP